MIDRPQHNINNNTNQQLYVFDIKKPAILSLTLVMYEREAVNNKIIHPLQFTMILKILNNGKKCRGNNSNVFITGIFIFLL